MATFEEFMEALPDTLTALRDLTWPSPPESATVPSQLLLGGQQPQTFPQLSRKPQLRNT